jgi:hypothetical protein
MLKGCSRIKFGYNAVGWEVSCEACSAMRNLGTNSAYVWGLKKTMEILD